jgi:hypothetical protein
MNAMTDTTLDVVRLVCSHLAALDFATFPKELGISIAAGVIFAVSEAIVRRVVRRLSRGP